MKPTDRAKFLEVLTGVHDFYGKDMTPFAVQVWVQACEAFDVQQVTKALSAHLMDPEHGRFMPKPADIVKQLQGTRTDRSLIAWGKVLNAMQRVGAYESVCFDDGLIHAAIDDLGGWPQMCQGKLDDLPFLERRFCDSYKAYANKGDCTFPAVMQGLHSIENGIKGFDGPKPMLIGDQSKALEVMRIGSAKPKTEINRLGSVVEQALTLPGMKSEISQGSES